jgi:hypothetical protein
MHVVCSNVCRWKYHRENTHGGHSITTKIKRGVAMQRDCEEHILGSVEQETHVEVLAGISRKEAPKVKKEEARKEKIEGATHNEGALIQGIKVRKLKEVQGKSLANAKPLKEFEQMDWIPIDFGEIFNKE